MTAEISSRFATVARVLSPPAETLTLPAAFAAQLSSLYRLVPRSQHVFASPLGPFHAQGRHHSLPRFVYFGPPTSDESLRLAFYTGFEKRDLRGTLALLHFIERLALAPDIGQGLEDLPVPPFELTLRLPAAWNAGLHREALAIILKRFVLRYRGLQAYAQHL